VLPPDVREVVSKHERRADLVEVVLDVGRAPEARFVGQPGVPLRASEVTFDELADAEAALGAFGDDNRAGVPARYSAEQHGACCFDADPLRATEALTHGARSGTAQAFRARFTGCPPFGTAAGASSGSPAAWGARYRATST
jgi:hypothetical protein